MKKLICAAIVTSLVLIAARGAVAGELPSQEQAAVQQLMGFEARRTMLEVCGITGDEADKYLANDIAQRDQLEASLSDAGKKSLRLELSHAREAIKASWDSTPADQRDKACAAVTAGMSQ